MIGSRKTVGNTNRPLINFKLLGSAYKFFQPDRSVRPRLVDLQFADPKANVIQIGW